MRIHIVIAIVGVYLELVFVMLYNNIYIYIYLQCNISIHKDYVTDVLYSKRLFHHV